MPTFTERVVINNPTDGLGLVVESPVTGVGAGASLTTTELAGSQGWTIFATGHAAAIGSDKLNVSRDTVHFGLRSHADLLTLTSDGKVGIGTTSPGFNLEIDAPNQAGLRITGPDTNGVGAGIQLAALDPGTPTVNSWEILATGGRAAQGVERFNIRDLINSEDIFTIHRNATAIAGTSIGIGTTTPTHKLHVIGDVGATAFNLTSSREIKDNIVNLCSQEAFEALEHLSPVKFNYKTESAKNVHIGFVAEDAPELVATADRKGVSVMEIVAILAQAVKEQQNTIKALVEKTHMLESVLNGAGR
jgi:hypothetical protein